MWAVGLLWALAQFASRNQDSGFRWLNRVQGLMMVVGLLVTALLPVSMLFLIAWWPLCFGFPMMIVQKRPHAFGGLGDRVENLQIESEITGVPFRDLVQGRRPDYPAADDLGEYEEDLAPAE